MKKLVIAFTAIIVLAIQLQTKCGISIPLAKPIVKRCVTNTKQENQHSTLNYLTQIFASYVDRHLTPKYKTDLDRKHYVYEIAMAAADIELSDPTMGCWAIALAHKESQFRIRKNKKSSASGLCQIIPRYHRYELQRYGIQECDLLESPRKSLIAGYAVFKVYFTNNPNYYEALLRYRGYGAKGLKLKTCEEYIDDVEREYSTLMMNIYG